MNLAPHAKLCLPLWSSVLRTSCGMVRTLGQGYIPFAGLTPLWILSGCYPFPWWEKCPSGEAYLEVPYCSGLAYPAHCTHQILLWKMRLWAWLRDPWGVPGRSSGPQLWGCLWNLAFPLEVNLLEVNLIPEGDEESTLSLQSVQMVWAGILPGLPGKPYSPGYKDSQISRYASHALPKQLLSSLPF